MKVGDLVKEQRVLHLAERTLLKGIILSFDEVGDPIVWWFSQQKGTSTFRWSVEVLSGC